MLATAMGYRLVRGFIRLLLWLFYRRVDVVGAERIPSSGPLIIAANHHNSLVDPMLIMATFPRRLTVLANAPLFRHPLVGPFLRAVGGLPVNRRKEAGDDPRKNEAMFATAIAHLRAGGAILIFPEGRTQPVPTLLPLRTGVARLLLGTEAALAWRREVMRAARALAERAPERVAEFRRRLEAYRAHLSESGLSDAEVGRLYTPSVVVRWTVVNAAKLAITLPLALWGIASHALPYALTRVAVAAMRRTEEEEATDKLAAGLVLYPLCWALEAWLVRRVAGVEALVVFLLLLAPAGLIALAWRARLERVVRQARAFGRFVVDRRLHADLIAERRALVSEAVALARLAAERRA